MVTGKKIRGIFYRRESPLNVAVKKKFKSVMSNEEGIGLRRKISL